jgi:hypothetical protein
MKVVVFDGSFNGFLTTVFEVYEYKMGTTSNQQARCGER